MQPAPLACVFVPNMPLQWLLRQHPQWHEVPVVLVADAKPTAPVLFLNLHAETAGLYAGMRFAEAQSVVPNLHAHPLHTEEQEAAKVYLLQLLLRFSPRIEADHDTQGLFWLDIDGLNRLFGPLEIWRQLVYQSLKDDAWECSIITGFQRLYLSAIAQHQQQCTGFSNPQDEATLAQTTPLQCFSLKPTMYKKLRELGLKTLGDVLRLSQEELRSRLGHQAAQFHHALAAAQPSIQAYQPPDIPTFFAEIDPPDHNVHRLLFVCKNLLQRLLKALQPHQRLLYTLSCTLHLIGHQTHDTTIEPATPTCDQQHLLELLRLRLSQIHLKEAVEGITLKGFWQKGHAQQLCLIPTEIPKRDPEAAQRALARLRALFGADAVTQAQCTQSHLPEGHFRWQPQQQQSQPKMLPHAPETLPLVRRLFQKPRALPSDFGSFVRLHGPHRLEGGWWVKPQSRDYFYAETEQGAILWIFFDRLKGQWFWHGWID